MTAIQNFQAPAIRISSNVVRDNLNKATKTRHDIR